MQINNSKPIKELGPNDVFDQVANGENVYVEFEERLNGQRGSLFICPSLNERDIKESSLSIVWFVDKDIHVKEEELSANILDFYLGDRDIKRISIIESFDTLNFTSKRVMESN